MATASVLGALGLGLSPLGDAAAADAWLAAVAVVAAWAPVRYRRGDESHVVTVEDAVVGAFLLTGRAELAPLAIMGAQALARGFARPGWLKFSFNLAPVGLGALAAVGVFQVLGGTGSLLGLRSIMGVTVALASYQVVSFAVTAELFRRLNGTSWRASLDATWRIAVLAAPGNVVLAVLLAVAVAFDLRAVIPVALLGVGVHLGYRGYLRASVEQRRAARLAELSRQLVLVSSGGTSLQQWLTTLCEVFGGQASALLLETPSGVQTHTSGDLADELGTEAVEIPAQAGQGSWPGGGHILVAPVDSGGDLAGALVVARRHGFESWGAADLALLSAIANEAAVARRAVDLFDQVERERARWAEESRKLNDILCAASDGIAMISSDGTIVSWNPGMTFLTGVEERQAGGKPWWTVLRLRDLDDEDLLPEGSHVVCSALAGERHPDPIALQVLRRDGTWRWLRATFSPLLEDDGAVAGSVIVARDVTAEREAEGLKADFVATVSHELRTPLTPIKGFLTTLQQRGPELTRDQIETMYSSMGTQVTRLERLVSDLLVVADLDRGRLVLASELVRLRPVVDIAVDDEAGRDRDRITVSGESELSAAADAAAVVRILRALISNALKHTEGPVEVELVREDRVAAIRVRDQGPGIPAWEQDRIFRRFHRLGDHLLRTQGPGLGLSIARALADRLGGAIDIDSELGHGATFTLRLRPAGPVPVGRRSSLADAG